MQVKSRIIEDLIRKRIMRRSGFTLVELLIAMAVFGLIMSISFGAIMASLSISRKADVMRQVQEESRDIVEYLRKDIKRSDLQTMDVNQETLTLTFISEPEHKYVFHVGATDPQVGKITMTVGSESDAPEYVLNSPNTKIEKIFSTWPVLDPSPGNTNHGYNSNSNYVTIGNLQLVSKFGGSNQYKFEIMTTISR